MAVSEITTSQSPAGEISIIGRAHGALNAVVVMNDRSWFFKQFITQQQFDDYAAENSLVVKEEADDQNNHSEER